jgi:hypothetical protein
MSDNKSVRGSAGRRGTVPLPLGPAVRSRHLRRLVILRRNIITLSPYCGEPTRCSAKKGTPKNSPVTARNASRRGLRDFPSHTPFFLTTQGRLTVAQINITITGVDRDAKLTWSGTAMSLTNTGGGNYAASFQSTPGTFVYSIVVFGAPADAWTAKVTDGKITHNHAGHMSPAGYDTTGDTPFTVAP